MKIEFNKKFIISAIISSLTLAAIEIFLYYLIMALYDIGLISQNLTDSIRFNTNTLIGMCLSVVRLIGYSGSTALFCFLYLDKKKISAAKLIMKLVGLFAINCGISLLYYFFTGLFNEQKMISFVISILWFIPNVFLNLAFVWILDNSFIEKRSFISSVKITIKRLGYYILLYIIPQIVSLILLFITNNYIFTIDFAIEVGLDFNTLLFTDLIVAAVIPIVFTVTVIYPKCVINLFNSRIMQKNTDRK